MSRRFESYWVGNLKKLIKIRSGSGIHYYFQLPDRAGTDERWRSTLSWCRFEEVGSGRCGQGHDTSVVPITTSFEMMPSPNCIFEETIIITTSQQRPQK